MKGGIFTGSLTHGRSLTIDKNEINLSIDWFPGAHHSNRPLGTSPAGKRQAYPERDADVGEYSELRFKGLDTSSRVACNRNATFFAVSFGEHNKILRALVSPRSLMGSFMVLYRKDTATSNEFWSTDQTILYRNRDETKWRYLGNLTPLTVRQTISARGVRASAIMTWSVIF